MAKASSSSEVVETKRSLTTGGINFAADAGAGMEGATTESFAIPFLSVLQKGSPEVDPNDGKFIEGAAPGMIRNTVTNKLYKGDEGVIFLPSYYRRTFLRWGPRAGEGGGFRGEMSVAEVEKMRAEDKLKEHENRLYVPMDNGEVNPKRCDRVQDTRNHYVVIYETGERALISLSSTQIKKSKNLMSILANIRMAGEDGKKFCPPTFATQIRMTTIPEANEQGTWFGVKFGAVDEARDADAYNAAKAFHDDVKQGSVAERYDSAPDPDGGPSREGF